MRTSSGFIAETSTPLFAKMQQDVMQASTTPDIGQPLFSPMQYESILSIVAMVLIDCTPELNKLDAQVIGTLIAARLMQFLPEDDRRGWVDEVQEMIREQGE